MRAVAMMVGGHSARCPVSTKNRAVGVPHPAGNGSRCEERPDWAARLRRVAQQSGAEKGSSRALAAPAQVPGTETC